MTIRYTGARITRREDPRLLRGRGRYVDDLVLPRMLAMAFVRSPHAHAAIRGVDTAAALAVPGVLAVVTADDLRALARPLRARLGGGGFTPLAWPPLADGRVHFCG
ncbi:MAG: xanthine dehydrogenase family protein molybdopterin-binding subunit, partial [Candidatus Rokuibacteriota bacterium]